MGFWLFFAAFSFHVKRRAQFHCFTWNLVLIVNFIGKYPHFHMAIEVSTSRFRNRATALAALPPHENRCAPDAPFILLDCFFGWFCTFPPKLSLLNPFWRGLLSNSHVWHRPRRPCRARPCPKTLFFSWPCMRQVGMMCLSLYTS